MKPLYLRPFIGVTHNSGYNDLFLGPPCIMNGYEWMLLFFRDGPGVWIRLVYDYAAAWRIIPVGK